MVNCEYSLSEPRLETNVHHQNIFFAMTAALQMLSFAGFFYLQLNILRAVPVYYDSDEAAVALFWLFCMIVWLVLNLPTAVLLLCVFSSRFMKRARKFQMACGISVIVSASLTGIFSFGVLTLFWPDGFSYSSAQWILYVVVLFIGIFYLASGIHQLLHLSPYYTNIRYKVLYGLNTESLLGQDKRC